MSETAAPAPRDQPSFDPGPHGLVPLGYDQAGNPLVLPSQASGWRVRRHSGRGRPGIIYSPNGGPLIVRLRATVEDLRAAGLGPGMYRLDACDANGVPVGVHAVTEVPSDDEDPYEGRAGRDEGRAREDAGTVRAAIDALSRAMECVVRSQVERDRAVSEILHALGRRPIDSVKERLAQIEERNRDPMTVPVVVTERAVDVAHTPLDAINGFLQSVVAPMLATLTNVCVAKSLGVGPEQMARLSSGVASAPAVDVSPAPSASSPPPIAPTPPEPAPFVASTPSPPAFASSASLAMSTPRPATAATNAVPLAVPEPRAAPQSPSLSEPPLPTELAAVLDELTASEVGQVRAAWSTLPDTTRELIAGHLTGKTSAQVVVLIRMLLARAFPSHEPSVPARSDPSLPKP